jgi:hypothetical protein
MDTGTSVDGRRVLLAQDVDAHMASVAAGREKDGRSRGSSCRVPPVRVHPLALG